MLQGYFLVCLYTATARNANLMLIFTHFVFLFRRKARSTMNKSFTNAIPNTANTTTITLFDKTSDACSGDATIGVADRELSLGETKLTTVMAEPSSDTDVLKGLRRSSLSDICFNASSEN